MRRRNFLHLTGAASALALAGCVGGDEETDDGTTGGQEDDGPADEENDLTPEETSTPESEGDDDPPEDAGGEDGDELGEHEYDHPGEAVEAFLQAWQDDDIEAANALIYEDGELEQIDEEEAGDISENAPEIEELNSPDIDDGTATVETLLALPEMDNAHPNTFELTLVDGAWKISDLRAEAESLAPQVDFDLDFDDEELSIMHTAGDAVPADELFVRGDGLGETGAWHELSDSHGEDDDVTAGNAIVVEVENEYSITLVWDDGETSMTLRSHSGAYESDSHEVDPVDSHLANVDHYDGTVEEFTGEDEVVVKTGQIEGVDQEFAFDPPAIRIDEGTELTWEWVGDGGAHNVVHDAGEPAFESTVKDGEGETFSHTFEESGTYLYVCEPHRALAMKGAVVVE